jgi:hypothetical protein
MWQPTNAKLMAISKMCVFMYVGENDDYMWHPEMKREAEFLRSKGPSRATQWSKGSPTASRRWRRQRVEAVRRVRGNEEGCSK